MTRFMLAASRVRTLNCEAESEGGLWSPNMPPKLAMLLRRYYPQSPYQLPFPSLRKLSCKGFADNFLILLLSKTLQLESLSLHDMPADSIRDLPPHLPQQLKILGLYCGAELDDPYEALPTLIQSLTLLEELELCGIHYYAHRVHPEPIHNPRLKKLIVQDELDLEALPTFLGNLVEAVPSVERLSLELLHSHSEVFSWAVDNFTHLMKVPGLKEFQLFTYREYVPADSKLEPGDVRRLGQSWKGLVCLNLFSTLGCSPDILDTFAEALPTLQYLALRFADWTVGDTHRTPTLANLLVLGFNVADIPPECIPILGCYLAFVCPMNVKISQVPAHVYGWYRDDFSYIIGAGSPDKAGELWRMFNKYVRARSRCAACT